MKPFTEKLIEVIIDLDGLDLSDREFTLGVERVIASNIPFAHEESDMCKATGIIEKEDMTHKLSEVADKMSEYSKRGGNTSSIIEMTESELTKREATTLFVGAFKEYVKLEAQNKLLTALLGLSSGSK